MSILDKHPAPWSTDCTGRVSDGNNDPVAIAIDTDDICYASPAAERLLVAAPRLLRALANIVVMVDGPSHHRQMAIDDANALIAEIEEE